MLYTYVCTLYVVRWKLKLLQIFILTKMSHGTYDLLVFSLFGISENKWVTLNQYENCVKNHIASQEQRPNILKSLHLLTFVYQLSNKTSLDESAKMHMESSKWKSCHNNEKTLFWTWLHLCSDLNSTHH